MRLIKAVLFEPVGCLAEFPAEPFNDIAARVFDGTDLGGRSGSDAYWRLLHLIDSAGPLAPQHAAIAQELELQAVEAAHLYEDVGPALTELTGMDIALVIASSMSSAAVDRFIAKHALESFFSARWSRDTAGGVGPVPLARAIESGSFQAEQVMVLADTADSLAAAKAVGAQAMLMINDYEEGRRLAAHGPAGGIVSLHELPDAIRFVAEGSKRTRQS